MKCDYDELTLSYYIDEDLANSLKEEIALHLKRCASCQTKFNRLQTARKIMLSLQEATPPRDYIESVRMHLKQQRHD
jgi:predicted anti-sigma-YlaC factor YlaD